MAIAEGQRSGVEHTPLGPGAVNVLLIGGIELHFVLEACDRSVAIDLFARDLPADTSNPATLSAMRR
jgi:hypothetical protein